MQTTDVAVLEREPMGKRRGRPKTDKPTERTDSVVRIDTAIVSKARIVAAANKTTVSEYLSDLLRGPVDRDFAREVKKIDEAGGGSKS